MTPTLRYRAAFRSLVIGSLALGGLACNRDLGAPVQLNNRRSRPAAEERVEIPAGTAAELLQLAKQSLRESRELAQAKLDLRDDKRQEAQRRDNFRLATLTGISAAEEVLANPDAEVDQRVDARKAKLLLLYTGAKHDRLKFEPPFDDYAQQLVEQHPDTEAAAFAVAACLELECLSKQMTKSEMLPKLAEHARQYPDHATGIKLFETFARELASRKDQGGARECYRQGIEAFAHHAQVDRLKQGLRRLEQSRTRRVSASSSLDAEEREIRRRLGYPNGYFVVYAEENVKPPRGSMMYFYHYEYEVLGGVEAAVAYVKNLPETYSWRVKRRYPDTSEGRRQAYELWKSLLNKKKTGSS